MNDLQYTNVCCSLCNTELIIGPPYDNNGISNITLARWNKQERKCYACMRKKQRGKVLYIQADGTKAPVKDARLNYGLSRDDYTLAELHNPEQVAELFKAYDGDLDLVEFTQYVKDYINGNKTTD